MNIAFFPILPNFIHFFGIIRNASNVDIRHDHFFSGMLAANKVAFERSTYLRSANKMFNFLFGAVVFVFVVSSVTEDHTNLILKRP